MIRALICLFGVLVIFSSCAMRIIVKECAPVDCDDCDEYVCTTGR